MRNWIVFSLLIFSSTISSAQDAMPAKELLETAWRQADAKTGNLVRFEPSRMVQFRDGELRFVRVVYRNNEILQLNPGGGTQSLGKFEIKKDEFILTDPAGKAHKFERLAKIPSELTLDPPPLAKAEPVETKKIKEVQAELSRREKNGTKLRLELRQLKDNDARAAKVKEMASADVGDTKYLIDLVKEVGWIDAERFGSATQHDAFLILMHTQNPALKLACLPSLEKEVRAGRFDAESYAGLYDRYCLQVALPDRYGMHITPNDKGELVVGPLEDRTRVDEFRKVIGLPPLAKYLDRYREENGGKAVRILE